MCMPKPKPQPQQKIEQPVVQQPEPTPEAPVLNETSNRTRSNSKSVKTKRSGTNPLRIALNIGGGNESALNIPT